LPKAKRLVNEPPFPTLPQAVVSLTREAGHTVSIEEASQFIQDSARRDTLQASPDTIIEIEPGTPTPLGPRCHEKLKDYVFPTVRMLRNGVSHPEAFRKIAENLNVEKQTAQAECTTELGIKTHQFVQIVSSGHIFDFLKEKYSSRKEEIDRELG
jgi:hypothetical protein